jgi:hypothetical protein
MKCVMAAITLASEPPAGMDGHDAARERRRLDPRKARVAHHAWRRCPGRESGGSIPRDSDRIPHRRSRRGRSPGSRGRNRRCKSLPAPGCRPARTPGTGKRPPSFSTRCISERPCAMRGTLRMPKAMVTASKCRSGKGSASALASTNSMRSPKCRSPARSRPTASMSPLMSATVACVRRAAGLQRPERDIAGAAGDIEEPPGRSPSADGAWTPAHPSRGRCSPPDIRSFIRS